ncbi:Putative heterokaryon incompatibility [Colletotrichum destructivum]|uniref:Heterokaryon incompatibility n=1 Tax=Colletotrichum destructivum TaxID=34406 RepID=A0AAX4HVY5_9PEZI|nr:Putative heterokaryon incompatibility [Colletotrichum destructivum]
MLSPAALLSPEPGPTMVDFLCDGYRTIFQTKWRPFSLLGSDDPSTRPGWHRNLSRLCHRTPCFVYEGRRSRLKPDERWICRRQAARSGEAAQKLADSMLSINYRPGPGAAAVKENLSRRGRHEPKSALARRCSEDDPLNDDLSRLASGGVCPRSTGLMGYLLLSVQATKVPHQDRRRGRWPSPQTHSEEFPRYCALSYFWDDPARHAQKKTLRGTLGTHESVIDPTGLTRTVADVVACCRRLGLPHLWVDALCIVQDDDDDKLSEIAAMGDIYANAYLTLAPFIAGGSDDGFLAPKENPFLSAPIPDIRSDGAPVDVKLVPSSRGLLSPSTLVRLKGQRPKPAKSSEPLHSRGAGPSKM